MSRGVWRRWRMAVWNPSGGALPLGERDIGAT